MRQSHELWQPDGDSEQWKGGLKIHAVGYGSGAICTTGMVARKNGDPIMITAGHCFSNATGNLGTVWEHGSAASPSDKIGAALHTSWDEGGTSSIDVGWLDIVQSWNTDPKNEIFGATAPRTMTALQPNTGQQVGDYICRSAFVSGYACGWIIDIDVDDVDVDGGIVHNLRRVDFDAIQGDSGRPYFVGNTYYGIHNDSTIVDYPDPGHSYYTSVQRIESVMDVQICVTASC